MNFVKARGIIFAVSFCVLCAWGEVINGVNINFVSIGEPGNLADTNGDSDRTGRGSVGYMYRLSTTEITIAQYVASGLGGGTQWIGVGSNAPAASVSWHDAARYCNWLTTGNSSLGAYSIDGGNKVSALTARNGAAMDALVSLYGQVYVIPTEEEWYKAAYHEGGGAYSSYADGTESAPSTSESRYGNQADPWLVGTGAIEQNNTFDMMGNVWEWMETTAARDAYDSGNDAQTMMLRGGAYEDSNATFLKANNSASADRDANAVIGFRVAAIPEPGTISLMSLSTLSLFITRSVRRRKRLGQTLIPVHRQSLCDAFYAEEAGEIAPDANYEPGYLDGAFSELARYCVFIAESTVDLYRALNKTFWNHMVTWHAHRLQKKKAFRQALKKKLLNGFDTFLALIMK